MSRARVLVIEDENKTAAFLSKGLREAGFAVDVACDGEKGLEQARATSFDLLIRTAQYPKAVRRSAAAERFPGQRLYCQIRCVRQTDH